MSVTMRRATTDDLRQLLPLLDDQFIHSKGRNHSLALRFPSVFGTSNASNIFLREERGAILSALAVKHFNWLEHQQLWHGAMIGAVYTNPQRRGEGHASCLLQWSVAQLHDAGADFAVLWTAQPAFYARLGWVTADDRGVLGETVGAIDAARPASGVSTLPASLADVSRLQLLRYQQLQTMVLRCVEDYRQLPIPAESIRVLWSNTDHHGAGYALVGYQGETGIIYEMVGDKGCFAGLFSEVCAKHQRILINDSRGSASYQWLMENTDVAWQEKQLAMWLVLSGRIERAHLAHWYIPYFDRI